MVGYVKAEMPRRMDEVRAIWLLGYHVRGAASATSLWQLQFGGALHVEQTNSEQRPGYLFTAPPSAEPVRYDQPRLISGHGIPTLSELNLTLTAWDGTPVVFDEAVFFLEFMFHERRTDLAIVAKEQGLREPVQGTNNWRGNTPARQHQLDVYAEMADHIFSHARQ